MLTTRDILRNKDKIHDVWKLGLNEDALTRDAIIAANIKQIAKEIISRREGFVLRLSGVLLYGVARLYSKKSYIFLIDCEDALAKISLRPQPSEASQTKKGKSKAKKAGKNNNDENIEIDEETLQLWRENGQIERIIEEEQRDNSHLMQSALDIQNSHEISNDRSSVLTPSHVLNDDDFGNTPFDPTDNIFTHETLNSDLINDSISDADVSLFQSDDDVPNNQIGENYDDTFKNETERDLVDIELTQNSKRRKKFQIDISPIIPMTQLSQLLEDTSATLCQRPKIRAFNQTDAIITSYEFDELLEEVKKITQERPILPNDISLQNKNDFNDDNDDNGIFINDLPEPPLMIDDNNDDEGMQHYIGNGYTEDERNHEEQYFAVDLIPDLKKKFKWGNEVSLLEITDKESRRTLSLTFFTALSLKTRGIVDLKQDNETNLTLIKGDNF